MATHLSKAGHELALYDIDVETLKRLESIGATAASPREVAERSDIVITMLPDGKAVQQVALGEQGLIHGFRPGALLLDTSSSEPWLTRETGASLEARGVAMVDAPVSGAQWVCAGRGARLHGGRRRAGPRAHSSAARLHGPQGVSPRRARRRTCNEVREQPDHRDDADDDRRGIGDRDALRPRSRGDGRRHE
jgi:6-phosphogluconate dehydrogenase (decarboxylating)